MDSILVLKAGRNGKSDGPVLKEMLAIKALPETVNSISICDLYRTVQPFPYLFSLPSLGPRILAAVLLAESWAAQSIK